MSGTYSILRPGFTAISGSTCCLRVEPAVGFLDPATKSQKADDEPNEGEADCEGYAALVERFDTEAAGHCAR